MMYAQQAKQQTSSFILNVFVRVFEEMLTLWLKRSISGNNFMKVMLSNLFLTGDKGMMIDGMKSQQLWV